MQTYISILRGINVSGHKTIKMEALRKMYEGLGLKNVRTYVQSGNVIFQDENREQEDLEKQIAKKIFSEFGFDVPVMVKKSDELETVLKNNPYVQKRNEDIKLLHVTFLSREPEKGNTGKIIDSLEKAQFAPDEFIISGSTVYLFCPNGYGRTKLTNTFFENKLKVVATTRNWKTVNKIFQMAEKTC